MAAKFLETNPEADRGTVIDGWRDNMALVTMELAVAGNRFAELSEGKDGKAPTAKLSGYGNNVASIAKGCIEFDDMLKESYNETRTAVQEKRREHRRATNPDLAQLQDSRDACDEAWKALRKITFDTNNVGLIDQITQLLKDHHADVETALKADAEAEAQAEAEADADAEPEAQAA